MHDVPSNPAGPQPGERRILRPTRWIWLVALGAYVPILGLTAIGFATGRGGWYVPALVIFSVFYAIALVEIGTRHIELGPGRITMVGNFRRRVVPREQIESVTWERGAGIVLRLAGGRIVRLPEVGHNSQGVTNTIRAWLKRTSG